MSRERNRYAVGLAGVALFGGLVADALAQEIENPVTVTTRDRPRYDATGIPAGGLRLYPELALEFRHDSNILATRDNEISDLVTELRPSVSIRSDWSRHAFSAGVDVVAARFQDYGDEDYTDYSLWSRGWLDFRDARLSGLVQYDKESEERTSPNARRGRSRTEFSTRTVQFNYHYKPAKFFIQPRFGYRDLEYDANRTADGELIDNSDRDRDRTELGIRAGFDISPDYSIFADLESISLDYDRPVDADGFNRDGDGARLTFGALIGLSDSVFGEAFLGYLDWEYDDPRFDDASGLTFGADVTWNISPLTTLNVNGSQRVRATTVNGSSGIDQVRFGARLDHELLRNVILSGELFSRQDDFQDIRRKDDIFGFSLGGRYLLNRHLSIDFGYEDESRDAEPFEAAGNEYDVELFFVRINGHL